LNKRFHQFSEMSNKKAPNILATVNDDNLSSDEISNSSQCKNDMLESIREKIEGMKFMPLGKPKVSQLKASSEHQNASPVKDKQPQKKKSRLSKKSDDFPQNLPSRFSKVHNHVSDDLSRIQSASSDIEDEDIVDQVDTSRILPTNLPSKFAKIVQEAKERGYEIMITQSTSDSEDDLRKTFNSAGNKDVLESPESKAHAIKPIKLEEGDEIQIIREVPGRKSLNIESSQSVHEVPVQKPSSLQSEKGEYQRETVNEVPAKKPSYSSKSTNSF